MRSFPVLILLMLLLPAGSAVACFGPKLYLGIPEGPRDTAIAAVVCLYIKEKTGVETVQVTLGSDGDLAGLRQDNLDMMLTAAPAAEFATLLQLPDGAVLLGGRRLLDDLQFTTVLPALNRLGQLLDIGFIERLMALVRNGVPETAAARQLMMELRWI